MLESILHLGQSYFGGNVCAMSNSADALRRWLGVFCLAMAAGMLIWGQTVLKAHLDGLSFLFYWLICLGFTMAAIVIALLDVRILRRRSRDEQRRLIERTLEQVEQPKPRKGTDPQRQVTSGE
jgi:hypothetical protein